MSNKSDTPAFTLDGIIQRRKELKKELYLRKEIIEEIAGDIFDPPEATTGKGEALMRTINTGMVIFDGVMLGFKVMKQIKQTFKSKTRRKKAG